MGFVFKKPTSPFQTFLREFENVKVRLKELWLERLTTSGSEIAAIISGEYIPTGSTGEGELNGVPTQSDIDNIIADTFVSHDAPTDEFALEDIPTEEEITAIINSTFDGSEYVSDVPSEEDISAIIGDAYEGEDYDIYDDDEILINGIEDILSSWDWVSGK